MPFEFNFVRLIGKAGHKARLRPSTKAPLRVHWCSLRSPIEKAN